MTAGPVAGQLPPHDLAPAIVVDGVTKRYGARTVLNGISLRVEPGELVALLGPNGAGKTTTVEIIEGYRRPDGGVVSVLGRDPARGGPQHRATVGLMLQAGGIDPRAHPRETLVQYGAFHNDPRSPDELLDLVGLRPVARTPYRRLSGGERQRMAFALALVGRPDVLILDEPTAGMDPEARASIRAIVGDERAAGTAILLTSHDLGDVERLADRVCVLRDGVIVASGSPAELGASVRPHVRFGLDHGLSSSDLVELGELIARARPGSRITSSGPARYAIEGIEPDGEVIASLAVWCAAHGRLITELRATGATLEEAYLHLVAATGDTDETDGMSEQR